ncbi:MAG TPA: hypothetical protein VIL01_15345 [Thermomicrobiales bacterium]
MSHRPSRLIRAWAALGALALLIGVVASLASPVVAQDDDNDQPFGAITSQQLIAAELEAGGLDYDTSLIYRAYALFGDPRLPEAYSGAGSLGEDVALFHEVVRAWDTLSPEAQEQLTPFIVRPTDERSVFAPRVRRGIQLEAGGAAQKEGCTNGWTSADSKAHPGAFKVWIACVGDYEGDLERAVAIIDEFWQPAIDVMGPPLPDTGGPDAGGDPALDFYFVEDDPKQPPRADAPSALGDSTLAVAIPAAPFEGNKASGFMVARRARLKSEGVKLDLAHEFFHILQNAHNQQIAFGFRSVPFGRFDILDYVEYWFVEATAVWMESYLYRDKIDPDTVVGEVYGRFINTFEFDEPIYYSPDRSSSEFGHIYAAFIWFYFVEQEAGPETIAQMWRNLQEVEQDDWGGALAALDAAFPFEENFREFAVRNLNLELEPGDPISPSYSDLDPNFPEGIRPPLVVGEGSDRRLEPATDDVPERIVGDTIKSLSAHYYYFVPTDDVARLTLDFRNLKPGEALDVDMIVNIEGKGWERRQLDPSQPITFCRANPDDNVAAFYLVLSNHEMDEATSVTGTFSVRATTDACS